MPAVSAHVIGLMSKLAITGNLVAITDMLQRSDYLAVDKVLRACGGKWERSKMAHVFPENPTELLDTVMLTGEYFDKKKSFDQFDSPPQVVDFVLDRAEIDGAEAPATLEPSAGLGYLATEAARRGAVVDCYEIDKARTDVLRENPLVSRVWEQDFMTVMPRRIYERVVMNPPFSKQQDIDHVLHALQFLEPGGLLVSVMSAGVLFRENRKTVEFRDKIADMGGVFERLPDGAFSVSGTNVSSVVLKVRA